MESSNAAVYMELNLCSRVKVGRVMALNHRNGLVACHGKAYIRYNVIGSISRNTQGSITYRYT